MTSYKRKLEEYLPMELWENIFFKTNKRLCLGFQNYKHISNKIIRERFKKRDILEWEKENDVEKRIAKMEECIVLIEKSESIKDRKKLKKGIRILLEEQLEPCLKRQCQELLIKIESITIGCDHCKLYIPVKTCMECYGEFCSNMNFADCQACGYMICNSCSKFCMNCIGRTCTFCTRIDVQKKRIECVNCISKCDGCRDAMSWICSGDCYDESCSKLSYCSDCLIECLCGNISCEDHVTECTECECTVCEYCIVYEDAFKITCRGCFKQ